MAATATPRLGFLLYGGATASLDGHDPTPYTKLLLSMFKYNGTTAFANSLRSTYPGIQKLYGYVTAADVKTSGVDTGLLKSDCDTHDAGVGGGATGDYWLLRKAPTPYPSGAAAGAYSSAAPDGNTVQYLGNIASTTFRSQWVSSTISKLQAAGVDGVFIDNCLGYLGGSTPVAPETGVPYTDATWATAMKNFIAAVVPQIQAAGFDVICNAHQAGDALGELDWIKQIGTYGGPMSEYWMQNGGAPNQNRLHQNTASDNFLGWINIASAVQGMGQKFHPEVDSTLAGTCDYSWACFHLRWDGTSQSTLWAGVANAPGTWAATVVDPGTPAANTQEVNADGTLVTGITPTGLFRRYYTNGIVLVNAHPTNSYTITSYGDGRTYTDVNGTTVATGFVLAPGTSKVLKSATAYSGAAPTGWWKVAEHMASYTSGTWSQAAAAPSHPVGVGDVVLVAVTRSFASNDLASETVTDTLGNTYTKVNAGDWDSSDVQSMTLYYSIITNPGTPIIYGNFPNPSNFISMGVWAFRNSGNTLTFDTAATYGGAPARQVLAAAGTDTITLPLTTGAVNDLVFGIWGNVSSAAAIAAGTGFTVNQSYNAAFTSEWKTQAAAGAMNATASPAGAQNVVGVAAAFKATPIPAGHGSAHHLKPQTSIYI